MELKQYGIVLVNLDPTVGGEMKKTRPAVIISPGEMNLFLQTIVITPLTSTSKPYPTRIQIKSGKTTGWITPDQIRTVDRLRMVKVLGQLDDKLAQKVKSVLKETYVN